MQTVITQFLLAELQKYFFISCPQGMKHTLQLYCLRQQLLDGCFAGCVTPCCQSLVQGLQGCLWIYLTQNILVSLLLKHLFWFWMVAYACITQPPVLQSLLWILMKEVAFSLPQVSVPSNWFWSCYFKVKQLHNVALRVADAVRRWEEKVALTVWLQTQLLFKKQYDICGGESASAFFCLYHKLVSTCRLVTGKKVLPGEFIGFMQRSDSKIRRPKAPRAVDGRSL